VTPNVDRAGRSTLHYAAAEGRAADVAAYLQEHGGDVNLADKAGFTPLHFAAQGQHADVAVLLIEAGADLHARNRFGNTALLMALVNVRDQDGQGCARALVMSEFPRCIYRAAQIEATVDKDTRDTSEAARIADHGLVVEPSAGE
jgi:Ankyrin repeats (many copies)